MKVRQTRIYSNPLYKEFQIPKEPDLPKGTSKSVSKTFKLSLVIPTYNEKLNIHKIVRLLTNLLEPAIPGEYELIVVDDNSPDETWKVAQEITAEYPQLKVIRRQNERGLSSAVVRGWQASTGEILGVIDADLQHPPEVLLQLFNAVRQGTDLAVASRHITGGGVSNWSLPRRILSRGAQTLGLIILPQVIGRVTDPMSGYFLVRRSAIAAKTLHPLGYKILIEVLGRGDIQKIAEVGYVFQEREDGESKVTHKQYVEYLQHLIRLRLSRGKIGWLQQRFPLAQFLRFALVGLSGVFVDMAIFYLLSDPSTLHWGLTRSKIISAELAIANNFLWNDFWTFREISHHQKGWKKRFKRFLKFNVVCSVGLVLNVLLLNLLFNTLGINRYLANLLAIGLITFWNFWINLKLSWRSTDSE
ncbi:MAG: glycosyltransferase [Cyanomargarita calcarea GSE-NOS-MK-12-04C]|jgi:dolichol-phosphate mannosyltransferase|uniref:Dolichol-phosphate mannosyltransferase n=1 Tax=Cyanomargarita calcarea GSE-NOS-MK-12-04C TaxID=2839659 RepID=A0A951QT16_9CYAN|nr:glycosyltransferase [Cyanomargarita calcarea GSE-NOS-MK-12-04C]